MCEYAEDAVVIVGKDKGQSAKICRNPECPIHGSLSQEQAERDEERKAEQKRRQREQKQKLQKRQALYRSILDAVSFPPTAEQFRFFTGVIVQGNAYRLRGFLEAHNLLGKGEKRSPLDIVREHLQVSEPAAVGRFAVSFLLYEAATNSYIDRADEILAEAAAAFKAKPAEKTKRAKPNTRARHTAKRARPKRKSRKGAA